MLYTIFEGLISPCKNFKVFALLKNYKVYLINLKIIFLLG